MENQERIRALKYAFPRTVPVMAGYLVLGAAYGILMNINGFGLWWALAISMFVYAGSLQYLGITFLTAAVNPVYAFFMSLMLNARHLFYGISMLDKYRDAGKMKPYLIFALTDETFSIVCHEEPPKSIPRYWVCLWISILDQCYWVAGTVLGVLVGSLITFDTAGLDFALTALFVVIFLDQWKSGHGHKAALTGVAASALCVVIFGQSAFIIPSMILIMAAITWDYKKKGNSGQEADRAEQEAGETERKTGETEPGRETEQEAGETEPEPETERKTGETGPGPETERKTGETERESANKGASHNREAGKEREV